MKRKKRQKSMQMMIVNKFINQIYKIWKYSSSQ